MSNTRNQLRVFYTSIMNEFLEYNIDQFIESACQMTFVDLLEVCNKNYQSLNNRKVSYKQENANHEHFIKEYKDYIHELLFLLNNGSKPGSMNEEYFQKSRRCEPVWIFLV